MSLEVFSPAQGSRVVADAEHVILFGQPPEVLKGLLRAGLRPFDTLVLADVKEKDGSLINNLEFPFYFFLFVAGGLSEGKRLRLIGNEVDMSQAIRLLRITLLGPTEEELNQWGTPEPLRQEWLAVARNLALCRANGDPIPVEEFFELVPFVEGVANVGELRIAHTGLDQYRVSSNETAVDVDLGEDTRVNPTYKVHADYVPGGLVKMGLEVLGGASGFTVDEPCTGLALCYNGDYLLIDSLPFLDQNLFARGIAKNQVSALLLTHLHDDHCAMFPLMMMPHRVEVITTREIFNMAMEKLALNLGWTVDVIKEHFTLVEVRPGERLNYFGLNIDPHVTVHSIPTIGATFSMFHQGNWRTLCVVGDNNNMTAIREMQASGMVRKETLTNLERLYSARFDMLIADGGAGTIHGNPADAIASDADRVVFVHVDELSPEFTTTFSLASSGKRYTVLEGDESLYTSQVNHYLTNWIGRPLSNRWMRSLLAEEEVRRYNQDDVILVQDADTRGAVYLILTGYCDVVRHDGSAASVVASLQAGDMIGEMAIITGSGVRNASVIATSPVSVCVFAEEIFSAFIKAEGLTGALMERWAMRPILKHLPQFSGLSSTALEKLGTIARMEDLDEGDTRRFDEHAWFILVDGKLEGDNETITAPYEFGSRPFADERRGPVTCATDCRLVKFPREAFDQLRLNAPQLNYMLRKHRLATGEATTSWLLGQVETT